ncbi:zinc finger protein 2 [Polypterus senegalus]|uniref:zinc finger protein 2 n=1 Tax=Polypterus senegalus TaxID=55291 RepID=UPI0019634DFF|nr:zinc finger protein 2 [Polypterus senegalus]
MNQLKYMYQDIQPVALHIPEERTTSRLYSTNVEGIEGQVSNLIEMFLVEVYRCKVCQFTSSLKNKIKSHITNQHEHSVTCHPLVCSAKEAAPLEEDTPYPVQDDINTQNKENEDTMEENLDRISFLLPMYRMFHNISPQSCDMGFGTNNDGLHVAQTCEVSTLFEEESNQFHLEDTGSVESGTLSCPMSSTCEDQDDEMAQSAHLMSLGLCRISSIKTQHLIGEGNKSVRQTKESPENHLSEKQIKDGQFISQVTCDGSKEGKDTNFPCSLCNLHFPCKTLLELHVKCHEGEQNFKCLHCSFFSTDWAALEKHLKEHSKQRRFFGCSLCDRSFRTCRIRDKHERKHRRKTSDTQCTTCLIMCSSALERDQHMACHFEDTFKCLHCIFTDKSWSKVYKHLCTTHGQIGKTHACPECDKRFCRKVDIEDQTVPFKNPSQYHCPMCSSIFQNQHQLDLHNSQEHQVRMKKIKRRSIFKISEEGRPCLGSGSHKRGNLEKDVMCHLCSRKFSSKLALQRHMGIHSGVKPYECQDCDYKTRLKASLIQHKRIHTGEKPFKCSQCLYASIDASSLRRHSRTHSNEKPYQCQQCTYSCIQKKSLDLHVRRHHTGEVFACNLCRYSSPDKQLLHRHLKKRHENVVQ